KPGEELVLAIPEELKDRPVRSVILVHRQEPSMDTGLRPDGTWDDNPGLTSVNLRDKDSGAWRQWNTPWGESGKWGAKFAEPRAANNPEYENLYDWHIIGNMDVETKGDLKTTLNTDVARIASVGKDPVFVHQLVVNFMGEKPSTTAQAL